MQVSDAGTYEIDYCVEATQSFAAGSRVVIEGTTTVAGSDIAPGLARSSWCRSAQVDLSASATFQVRLYGYDGSITLANPGGVVVNVRRIR